MPTRFNDWVFGDLNRGFSTLQQLRREMDRVFGDFESRNSGPQQAGFRPRSSDWPRITLDDTGTGFGLRAEVPGFAERDLKITVEQNSLTIQGERKLDTPEGYSVHRRERSDLAFARSFTLPARVDAEKTVAVLKHGVLELNLPRVKEEQPHRIQVTAS